jgi:RNA polymerase sigma factor (sigma-70 family)
MSSQYFSNYLAEIGNVPLLPPQREIELSQIIQRGLAPNASELEIQASGEGRIELARHSLRLVVSIASGFHDSSLTLEEMTFTGNVGLMEAAKRFKGAFKTRFSTYAFYWIQMTIREAIRRSRVIRTPVRRGRLIQRIRQAQSFREEQSARDLEKLHHETGIPTKSIKQVLQDQCLFVSLDRPTSDESGDGIEALLPADDKTPAEVVSSEEELSALAKAVTWLTPCEQGVICGRFGINRAKIETLRQIATHYGISVERVRQIEKLALKKLRSRLQMGDNSAGSLHNQRACLATTR